MIIIRNYEAELDLLTMGITMNKGLSDFKRGHWVPEILSPGAGTTTAQTPFVSRLDLRQGPGWKESGDNTALKLGA